MRKKYMLFIIPVVLLLAAGAAGAWWHNMNAGDEADADTVTATVDESNMIPAAGGESVATPIPQGPQSTTADAVETPAKYTPADIHIRVEGIDPKAPKSVGSIDAPVTMIEYASLTCPHCAHAHETVLPTLIKDYVETGKLRIVFSDFPLNQPALDASKVARCMPNDQYFAFLTLLFGSIEKWAYSGMHPQSLIQNAVLAGLPEQKAKDCLADTDVEKAILESIQKASEQYQVNSTPTFILNNGEKKIEGARPLADFTSAIDELIARKAAKAGTVTPETTPAQ